VSALYVAAVGDVAAGPLELAAAAATDWFPFPVRRLAPLDVPPRSWDPARRQHQSVEFMKALVQAAPADAVRVLGLTECDLSIPLLTFLFGQAQLDGLVAVVSLHRLRPEFYGLPPDEDLLRDRLAKEMLHEMGHTFGLTHCLETACAMSLSTHIEFVDAKAARYCAHCAARLARRFTTLETPQ
jgi:archaemetzincin